MSLLQFQKKHPRIYKKVFRYGVLAERAFQEIEAKSNQATQTSAK